MSIIDLTEEEINQYVYVGIVKNTLPLKGRKYSNIELSVKSKFNGSQKVKSSHFINDLFANTHNTLPEHLQYQNKYSGTYEEKKAILNWLSYCHKDGLLYDMFFKTFQFP